ncbi:hypothetical protein A3H09_02885 [Candidatus Falkowbacteria bacterium RIFCSPLOWO2_12_FULL_45_13]|uniref:Baseplate protein J-like domain-containing protein n=2 Tax=Candidatus Falkowiibacteriota TaxID=1752728 RepID=A0A1F5SCH8_9BACT|nr:MAG: hypothetical protein A3H66_01925 [Candidatus Falkowbacteria bacterium RIFCSPLOWO2_02_FULL_45_21]OGF29891.1 MAG: hypothetical protein A3H09_02885 [Candidatus Falkowbacteria bacterium RIFCSPLOWO2_12_FULL_45_13]
MPETNFLVPPQAAVKKSKQRTSRKSTKAGVAIGVRKADKPPFKINENFNTIQSMPRAGYKIKENLTAAKKSEAKNIYFKIAGSFIALTVILVLAVLYLGFAKATLIIIPTQEKVTDSLNVTIVDMDSTAGMAQGEILGIVRQVPLEQSQTFTATGKKILGEEVTGQVTIINDYLKNQPLVATTRLLSQDNKLFRLKNTVNVPAGGRVVAEVYADEAKPDMAIGPSKFTIPGLWAGLQDKIYAQSQSPMAYQEKVKYIITQSDIDKAVSGLKLSLLTNAKKEISQAYQEYEQSIIEVDNNSISQEVQGKVGEEKDKFTIKIKTKITVAAFKDNDIYSQVRAKLINALADDKEIVELRRADTAYHLGGINLSQGTATVDVDFVAKVTLKDNAKIIKKNNLAGLNNEQLKAYLNSLPEVAGYEVKFFPAFLKKMPNLVDRIEVVIKK